MNIRMRTLSIAVGALALAGVVVGDSLMPTYAATTMPACADQLKTFKAELNKAPNGTKTDAARKDYKAAVAAHKNNDDATCMAKLTAAQAAMK